MKAKAFVIGLALMGLSACSTSGQTISDASSSHQENTSSSQATGDVEPKLLFLDGGEVDQETLKARMFVSPGTDSVLMSSKVAVSEGCAWSLYRGETEIRTKVAAGEDGRLADGDNLFYIEVINPTSLAETTYELTIHRSYAVTISYQFMGTSLGSKTAYTGYEFELEKNPSMIGYTLDHWEDALGNPVEKVVPWGDLVFYAVAKPNGYVVTLDPNGGEVSETSIKVAYDDSYSLPVPTRKGYTFEGWYLGTEVFAESGVWTTTSNISLTARWSIITYTITYELNGGTNSPYNPATYTVEDGVAFADPSKTGYAFSGWTSGGSPITSIPMGTTGDLTLIANWNVCVYQVSVVINDESMGSISGAGSYDFGSVVTLIATPIGDNIFDGWYSDSSFTNRLSQTGTYSFELKSEGLTIYAKFITLAERQEEEETRGKIVDFFKALGACNNYTATVKGGWEKGESPSDWYYDTGKEILLTYECEKRFTPKAFTMTYKNVKETATLPFSGYPLASEFGFVTGASTLYLIDNANGVFSSDNLDDSYNVGKYEVPKAILTYDGNDSIPLVFQEGEDFSDHRIDTYGILDYEGWAARSTEAYDFIGNASWTLKAKNESEIACHYNFSGEDCTKLYDAENSLYGFWGVMFSIEDLTSFAGWCYYVRDLSVAGSTALNAEIIVARDLRSLTFHVTLPLNASSTYGTTITINNVGTTVMPDDAQAVIDAHNASLGA